MKIFAPLFCASLLLFGAPSYAQSVESKIIQLEDNGALPKLDRSASLRGPDINKDGVRDDVEAYIKQKPFSDAEKRALLQHARVLQAMVIVDKQDKATLQNIGVAGSASINCVFAKFKDNQAGLKTLEELESITANTKDRLKSYLAYSEAMDGSVSTIPDHDTCK